MDLEFSTGMCIFRGIYLFKLDLLAKILDSSARFFRKILSKIYRSVKLPINHCAGVSLVKVNNLIFFVYRVTFFLINCTLCFYILYFGTGHRHDKVDNHYFFIWTFAVVKAWNNTTYTKQPSSERMSQSDERKNYFGTRSCVRGNLVSA